MKVKQVADFIGLTPRRIQELAKQGIIPKSGRGDYELGPVVRAYIKYLRDELASFNAIGGIMKAEARPDFDPLADIDLSDFPQL